MGYLAGNTLRVLNKSKRDLQRLSPDGRVKPEAYAGRKMLGLTALYKVKD